MRWERGRECCAKSLHVNTHVCTCTLVLVYGTYNIIIVVEYGTENSSRFFFFSLLCPLVVACFCQK